MLGYGVGVNVAVLVAVDVAVAVGVADGVGGAIATAKPVMRFAIQLEPVIDQSVEVQLPVVPAVGNGSLHPAIARVPELASNAN